MNAAFYEQRSRPAAPDVGRANGPRARRIHRWVATVFVLAVAANFAAMPWGTVPAWITYAPLPPLLFLLGSGLVMLVSPWVAAACRAKHGDAR